MIQASQKTIVPRRFEQVRKTGFWKDLPLEDVEQIITDSGISEHTAEVLKSMGIEVTIV